MRCPPPRDHHERADIARRQSAGRSVRVVIIEDLREVRESLAVLILRERLPDVPILALTVYDDVENVFHAICAAPPSGDLAPQEMALLRLMPYE